MSKYLSIDDDSYKKFQAALMLTGEEEEVVLRRLINKYTHKTFETVMGKTEKEEITYKQSFEADNISAEDQKQRFTNWFRSLTRNGKPYNQVTISGYTGRIENACRDSVFESVPVDNLFTITELSEFMSIQKQIKSCDGYMEFDAKSHNGFTAALRKYEEFLRFQENGNIIPTSLPNTRAYMPSSGIHRWTVEEDEICCKRFLEYYVINKRDTDMVQFLQMLAKEVPNVSEGSLRMKIQNIKYLSMQAGFEDTSTIKWLSQYSMQCEKAFRKAIKDMGISM